MCFHIVSFSAQAVESLKGLGQEYQRQVVPEVVHAHLEELLLSKLLWTGKSRGSPPCNELRDRFTIPLLGLELFGHSNPSLCVAELLPELRDPCFPSRDRLFREVGVPYHVKAGPSNDCTKSLRHSAPFCATGPHLTRKCALTHSILIERFRIRRNEARSARYSFIIQTDAPLSQSSGFIVQSIIRTGNRKWPEWLLWVECSSLFP